MIRYNVKVNDQIYQVDLEKATTTQGAENTESSADICFEAIKAEYDYCVTRAEKLENKDFYVNKLGFSVIRENYRPERKDWKLDLRVNEYTELEIFAEENPPKRVNRPEACGLRHLAFCVDSVEQTVRELAEVGIECEPIRVDDYTGKKMTFFHDPDGLPLELHE